MKTQVGLTLAIVLVLMISLSWEAFTTGANHDELFSSDKLLAVHASQLKRTIVTASLNTPIDTSTNVLWCGTFQLAWNEACVLVGEDLHFNPEAPAVAALNKKLFTRDDIDDPSYVALAGFVRDQIHKKIRDSLQAKFGGAAAPQFIPAESLTPRQQDIVAYAYLFKNLEFALPFERLDDPLRFGSAEVSTFGLGTPKPAHQQMAPQVVILDYASPDDFVIELKTKSEGDRLILAKIEPKASLAETVAAVKMRIDSSKPQTVELGDRLAVPKFNFDITREYEELEGAKLVVQNPNVAKDLLLQSAVQDIRFQMDEKGVRLKSESHMAFGCAQVPSPTHLMIFDKPFLVILERADAKSPYFVMWVSNPELLVPW